MIKVVSLLIKHKILLVCLTTIILSSILVLYPYLTNGIPKTDDGEWMVVRFSAFHQTLISGQFPVRFLERLNHTYGYPVANFLYPGPFYIAEIFYLFLKSYTLSIKAVFITSTILSAIIMFVALSTRFTKSASTVGAIFYLFYPYRLIDLYSRGSLGEIVSFTALPLFLFSILKITPNNNIYFMLIAISTALLVLSHNIIAAIFLPIFFLIALILKVNILKFVLAIGLGLMTSAFFWLPAIHDLRYVQLAKTDISQPSAYLNNFSLIINPISKNALEFYSNVGLLSVIIIVSAALFLKNNKNKLVVLIVILTTVSIFLMSKQSAFIWDNLSFTNYVQFPWRLNSIVLFSLPIITAYVLDRAKNKIINILLALLIIILSNQFLIAQNKSFFPDSYYSTNEDTTTVKGEYMPLWVTEKPTRRPPSKLQDNNNINLMQENLNGSTYEANILSKSPTTLVVNTVYFPGHSAKLNNQQKAIKITEKTGLISLDLPEGNHKVIINYGKTLIHLISEIISVIGFLIISIIFSIYLWHKKGF